ncbi:hypothetical protein Scep_021223 [Stephania cephalantha]|uniref:Uncharacterized protein n=1 Tax=Stephania cephalantha TaxID=152367 RepID=A0AAP0FCZ1_9MAGN
MYSSSTQLKLLSGDSAVVNLSIKAGSMGFGHGEKKRKADVLEDLGLLNVENLQNNMKTIYYRLNDPYCGTHAVMCPFTEARVEISTMDDASNDKESPAVRRSAGQRRAVGEGDRIEEAVGERKRRRESG